jgi:CheY-like chemotaxis protein
MTDELRERAAEARAKAAEVLAEAKAIRDANRRLIEEARRVREIPRPKRERGREREIGAIYTLLLVEDDASLRYAAARFLTKAGFDVVDVADTMQALIQLDAGQKIDLAIVDIVMPKGTPNGVAFARMARTKRPGFPVMFTTGHKDLVGNDKNLPGPIFSKPVDLDGLAKAITAKLGD